MNFMLCDLGKGKEGVILGFSGEGILFHRLQQFGVISGTKIAALGAAPLGSPMLFRVRGATIALRAEDCREISVMVP